MITPPGRGSEAGLHVHVVDQIFYIIEGQLEVHVGDCDYTAQAGDIVVFPAGVPHSNWNEGHHAAVHLSIVTPTPDAHQPFARPRAS